MHITKNTHTLQNPHKHTHYKILTNTYGSVYNVSSPDLKPFPTQFFGQPHTPQLLFVLGGKEVGGLLVIILQF
jgi:hypothetical protein